MRAVYLNLGPPSVVSIKEANADIRAILKTWPQLLMGAEAVAKGALPNVTPYGKVRDFTPPGRANLYAYGHGGIQEESWEDCERKFPRNKAPGMHPARSVLRFPYEQMQCVDAHHPPLWEGAGPARAEHQNVLRKVMAPWTTDEWDDWGKARQLAARERPRLLMWDRNMSMDAAREFAASIDARVVGEKIDCAIVRNIRVQDYWYQREFEGHTLHTDHPWGAFVLKFEPRT